MIQIAAPTMFIVDEIRKRYPDSFDVFKRLHFEFDEARFALRANFLRDISRADWPELRLWGAIARLFGNEFLVVVPDTLH